MTQPESATAPTSPAVTTGVIDTCVHHHWASQQEINERLSSGWRAFIGKPGLLPGGRGMAALLPPWPWERPAGPNLPETGPLTDPDALLSRLDREGIGKVVLSHEQAMLAPVVQNPMYGLEVVRAVNDWTVERWLGRDRRLHALALVPNQLPDAAAREIRRVGSHPQVVGVLMGGNGLSKPFGNPVYNPIHEAAGELGLPVVIHTGGDAPPNTFTHPTAGGYPSTFTEFYALRAQPLIGHLVSFIDQGVLEKNPDLKIMLVGGGVHWIVPWIWRTDTDFHALAARETTWLKRFPSEQLFSQVRISTYSNFGAPPPEASMRMLGMAERLADVVCYGSGWPRWDSDSPAGVADCLPASWRAKALRENAETLFRWPKEG